MFQKKKSAFSMIILGIAIVFVSGCSLSGGEESATPPVKIQNGNQEESQVAAQKLSEPTGKVNDLVNSYDSAISSEDSIISGDESYAQEVVNDDQETNDFNQISDENENEL